MAHTGKIFLGTARPHEGYEGGWEVGEREHLEIFLRKIENCLLILIFLRFSRILSTLLKAHINWKLLHTILRIFLFCHGYFILGETPPDSTRGISWPFIPTTSTQFLVTFNDIMIFQYFC